jgi:hypothetical protein
MASRARTAPRDGVGFGHGATEVLRIAAAALLLEDRVDTAVDHEVDVVEHLGEDEAHDDGDELVTKESWALPTPRRKQVKPFQQAMTPMPAPEDALDEAAHDVKPVDEELAVLDVEGGVGVVEAVL